MGSEAQVFGLAGVVALLGATTLGCSSDQGKPGPVLGTSSGVVPDPDAGGGDGGGKLGVAAQGCKVDPDCTTNHCFVGGNQSFCTVPCTVDNAQSVCVAPLTGTCNKQGWCKRD
jgi:hypothetical protein